MLQTTWFRLPNSPPSWSSLRPIAFIQFKLFHHSITSSKEHPSLHTSFFSLPHIECSKNLESVSIFYFCIILSKFVCFEEAYLYENKLTLRFHNFAYKFRLKNGLTALFISKVLFMNIKMGLFYLFNFIYLFIYLFISYYYFAVYCVLCTALNPYSFTSECGKIYTSH